MGGLGDNEEFNEIINHLQQEMPDLSQEEQLMKVAEHQATHCVQIQILAQLCLKLVMAYQDLERRMDGGI